MGKAYTTCFAKIFRSSAKCTWKGPVASREPRDGLRGSDSSSVCGSRAKRLQIRRFDVWKSCKRNCEKGEKFLVFWGSKGSKVFEKLSRHKMRTEDTDVNKFNKNMQSSKRQEVSSQAWREAGKRTWPCVNRAVVKAPLPSHSCAASQQAAFVRYLWYSEAPNVRIKRHL